MGEAEVYPQVVYADQDTDGFEAELGYIRLYTSDWRGGSHHVCIEFPYHGPRSPGTAFIDFRCSRADGAAAVPESAERWEICGSSFDRYGYYREVVPVFWGLALSLFGRDAGLLEPEGDRGDQGQQRCEEEERQSGEEERQSGKEEQQSGEEERRVEQERCVEEEEEGGAGTWGLQGERKMRAWLLLRAMFERLKADGVVDEDWADALRLYRLLQPFKEEC